MNPTPPIKELIHSFVETLSAEKGYSVNTCRAYRNDLDEFAAYLAGDRRQESGYDETADDLRMETITPIIIRGYLGYLHQKNKKSTIARKLSGLRTFFKYLVKYGFIEGNPTGLILTPKQDKTIPTYLPVDEMFFLLDNPPGTKGGEGNRILSFVPHKMLSFEWNAPPQFTNVRKEKTWCVLLFDEIEQDTTKIRFYQLGWREGKEWDDVYNYFQEAWDYVFNNLKKYFQK